MKQIWLITCILALPILNNAGSKIFNQENYRQPGRVKDILVLSVAGDEDSTAALNMERQLANELKSLNYAAESAIAHFGKNAFAKIREEETIKQLYPYDAVIIITLVNENQQQNRKPSECDNFFWEYYDGMYSLVHNAHLKKAGKSFWETSFFEISNWKLQYRKKSLPFSSNQVITLIPKYCKSITKDMRSKNIIRPITNRLKAF